MTRRSEVVATADEIAATSARNHLREGEQWRNERYKWPKNLPPLTAEQQAISDDFMRRWLAALPKKYGAISRFNHHYPTRFLPQQAQFRTIEIGAGDGEHLAVEQLGRQDYHCIELRKNVADVLRRRFPSATTTIANCQDVLPYPDKYFDRALAIHVLEHLPRLPDAISELRRILRPGGILSIVIPCDPGLAYGLARKISAERMFKKLYEMPYDWLIRREHINSPAEILTLLRANFVEVDRAYFPSGIPVLNLNLVIGATFRKCLRS